MKIIITKEGILNKLAFAQSLTSRNTNMEVTNSVLLSAQNNLTLYATDLSCFYEASIQAEINRPGSMLINSKKIFEIIKEMPEDEIYIDVEDRLALIKSGKVTAEISTGDVDDFLEKPKCAIEVYSKMSRTDIKRIVNSTTTYSPADKRAHISSFLFSIENGKMDVINSDNRRVNFVYIDDVSLPEGRYLVEKKAMPLVAKMNSDVEFGFDSMNDKAVFESNIGRLIISLTPGMFPDVNQIMNAKKEEDKIVVLRDIISRTLLRMKTLFTDDFKGFAFEFGKNSLKATTSNPQVGYITETIDIENVREFAAGFNPVYILEALNNIDSVEIEMYLHNNTSPLFIKAKDNAIFLGLVMPIKLDRAE